MKLFFFALFVIDCATSVYKFINRRYSDSRDDWFEALLWLVVCLVW